MGMRPGAYCTYGILTEPGQGSGAKAKTKAKANRLFALRRRSCHPSDYDYPSETRHKRPNRRPAARLLTDRLVLGILREKSGRCRLEMTGTRRRQLLKIALLTIVLTVTLASSRHALGGPRQKVVLFLMDNTTWEDWVGAGAGAGDAAGVGTRDGFLPGLVRQSSIGLLNNEAATLPSRPRGYLTVSGGARATGSVDAVLALDAGEHIEDGTAAEAFTRRMARRGAGQVLVLGQPTALKEQEEGAFDSIPGSLGGSLVRSGRTTAVLGNSDTSFDYSPDSLHREAAVIAMGDNGAVDLGMVGKKLLVKDDSAAFGLRTNDRLFLSKARGLVGKADLTVVDAGDTVRADLYARYSTPRAAEKMRRQAMRRAAALLRAIYPQIKSGGAVLIVASLLPPGTGNEVIEGTYEQLTPILINGPGWGPGYLESPGTHRKGLVSNVDLAPTILDILGVTRPASMLGRPVRSVTEAPAAGEMIDFGRRAVALKLTRPVAIITFIYFQLAIFIACSLFLLKKRAQRSGSTTLRTLLLSVLAYPPVTFLTSSLFPAWPPALFTGVSLAAAMLLAWVLHLSSKKDPLRPPILLTAGITALIVTDIILGGPLQLAGIFGYDPVRGSRFFGLGNESMAILLASTLLLFGLISDRSQARNARNKVLLAVPLFVGAVLTIGLPGLGANTGGTIAAVAAYGVVGLLLLGGRLRGKLPYVGLAILMVLGLFVAADVVSGSNSHMGRSFELVRSGGLPAILVIAKRKLVENVKILRYSTWSYFLLFTVALLGVLTSKPTGPLKTVLDKHQTVSIGIKGAIAGGLVGFLANDSGIVIPGIILSYFMSVILYLMLDESESLEAPR